MKTSIKLALLVAAGLFVYSRLAAAKTEVDYSKLAGPPVPSALFTRLIGWQDVRATARAGWPTQLIVQTSPSKALLLTLFAPCQDLDFSIGIGVTSFGHRISAGFDKVLVAHRQSCRIKTIQPLDVKAMRAAEKLARQK